MFCRGEARIWSWWPYVCTTGDMLSPPGLWEFQSFVNSLLSPPSRTWSEFKKLFGSVLSRRGPGSSPGFVRLSDPPPVLLAQLVGQPESTTGIRPSSLEFRGVSGGLTLHSPHMQWLIKGVNVKKLVKLLIIFEPINSFHVLSQTLRLELTCAVITSAAVGFSHGTKATCKKRRWPLPAQQCIPPQPCGIPWRPITSHGISVSPPDKTPHKGPRCHHWHHLFSHKTVDMPSSGRLSLSHATGCTCVLLLCNRQSVPSTWKD